MVEECKHGNRIADNYGMTCLDCGQVTLGFGYRGHSPYCIHEWYGTEHMFLAVCNWCQAATPNEKYKNLDDAEAAAEGAFCD